MTPTGSSPGLPRNAEERADSSWVKETAQAAIAARPSHRSMVLAQPGDKFRAWCTACGDWLSPATRSQSIQKFVAGSHERANQ